MPIFQPNLFQGAGRRRRYFEGWYFKQVAEDGRAWSFIPGISIGADGSKKAFVQAIDGDGGRTRWYEFPFASFSCHPKRLELAVGPNRFGLGGVELDLDGPDGRLKASLRYGPTTAFPSRPWRPGIMGPYSFVPFMECRHGLVSLDHEVAGRIETEEGNLELGRGRGYIEKDWGSSMPSAWIWTQSNGFAEPGASLMFSLANIPWLGGSFPGFLCAARLPEAGAPAGSAPVRIWATWNGARVARAEASDARIELELRRGAERLTLGLERGRGGLLLAPVAGSMERRIAESVDAAMSVRLERGGELAFEGRAAPAGLETVGELSSLGVSIRPSGA